MASGDRHWVEDLFPPVYSLTIEDLLEDGEEKPASVYELAAKRISKFDPERIKNVFERVWLMKTIEEQQRQQKDQDLDGSARSGLGVQEITDRNLRETEAQTSFNLGTGRSNLEQIILQALREDQGKSENEQVDINDSKLWTSNEIKEIRKVYGAARKENIKLRAALEEAESRVKKLVRKNKQQFVIFAGKEDALEENQKANKRLQILSKTLKTNFEQVERDNCELEDEVEELKQRNNELLNEISDTRKMVDTERIRRQNAEIDVEDVRKAALREAELQIEGVEIRYDSQIQKLERKLEQMKTELDKERNDHNRTRKGLEHLQKHFASLPYMGSESRKTMVTSDQLTAWTT